MHTAIKQPALPVVARLITRAADAARSVIGHHDAAAARGVVTGTAIIIGPIATVAAMMPVPSTTEVAAATEMPAAEMTSTTEMTASAAMTTHFSRETFRCVLCRPGTARTAQRHRLRAVYRGCAERQTCNCDKCKQSFHEAASQSLSVSTSDAGDDSDADASRDDGASHDGGPSRDGDASALRSRRLPMRAARSRQIPDLRATMPASPKVLRRREIRRQRQVRAVW